MANAIAHVRGGSERGFSWFLDGRKFNKKNTFTDFVNRVRVNRACQLLMESDRLVTHICYDVGFNNDPVTWIG